MAEQHKVTGVSIGLRAESRWLAALRLRRHLAVLGIAGAGMMTLMLLYSLRKRVRWFHRLGSLSRWLDVHIFLGIVGPCLVVLHSAFKVGGLVALSFWSMVAVVVSRSGLIRRASMGAVQLSGSQLSWEIH